MKTLYIIFGIIALVAIFTLTIFNNITGAIRYSHTTDDDYIYIMKIEKRILWGSETTLYRINISNNQLEMCFRTKKLYSGITVDDEDLYFQSFDWFKAAVYTTGIFRLAKDTPFDLKNVETIPDSYYQAHASDKAGIGGLRVINTKLFRSFCINDKDDNRTGYWMDKEGNLIGEVFTEEATRFVKLDYIFYRTYNLYGNQYKYEYYSIEENKFIDFPLPHKWQNEYAVINKNFYVIEPDGISRFNAGTGSIEYLITDNDLDYKRFAFSENEVYIGTKDANRIGVYSLENRLMINEYNFPQSEHFYIANNVLYTVGKDGIARVLDLQGYKDMTYRLK